jgi:hypothetical protein
MTVEAPISKYKKTNFKIFFGICIAVAVIFAYDGYLSKYKWSGRYGFYKKNVLDNDGKPTPTMNFNRKSPPFFLAGAVLFAVYLYLLKDKRLIADENELVISSKKRISYDSIQQIDKTHFRARNEKRKFVGNPDGKVEVQEDSSPPPEGYFIITYKNKNGKKINYKISDRKYDNLPAVLEHLVAKIT